MSFRTSVVAGSLALLALIAGGRRADGQMRPQLSASATVLLTAQVAPRMEPTHLGVQSITPEGDTATVVTRLDVGANIPHRVVARLGASDASGAVALRDSDGHWVQAVRGSAVVVAAGAASGSSSHLIACRVAAADAAAGCPVALEIVSADPRHPMRVSFAGRRSR